MNIKTFLLGLLSGIALFLTKFFSKKKIKTDFEKLKEEKIKKLEDFKNDMDVKINEVDTKIEDIKNDLEDDGQITLSLD